MRARVLAAYVLGALFVIGGGALTAIAMDRAEAIPTWLGVMVILFGAVIIAEAGDA